MCIPGAGIADYHYGLSVDWVKNARVAVFAAVKDVYSTNCQSTSVTEFPSYLGHCNDITWQVKRLNRLRK